MTPRRLPVRSVRPAPSSTPTPSSRLSPRSTPAAALAAASLRAPLVLLAVLLLPVAAAPQVVSPGRLTAAHAELEGLRRCTECHELGRAGVAPERCLACHEPLARRMAGGRGFHARLEETDCAACHREHLGREAALVRLDTARFRHEDAGFELRGAHAELGCRSCHRAELVRAADVRAHAADAGYLARTMLGLPTACAGCHQPDSPHGTQFADRGCDDCHGEERWEDAGRFDHARTTFRLTGAHRHVACGDCHSSSGPDRLEARYAGIEHGSCAACHVDPHAGSMDGECRECHTTEGWHRVSARTLEGRFDHDRTGFRLTGGHAPLECAACHRPAAGAGPPGGAGVRIRFARGTERATYPRPLAGSCAACHVDPHRGELDGDCGACHRDTGWIPTRYGPADHAATAFPLTGAHAAVPCGECHAIAAGGTGAERLAFRLDPGCATCHAPDDPHGGVFGDRPCSDCHGTARFTGAELDHATVRGMACRECHAVDDPHGGQFRGETCDRCHGVESFRVAGFDHHRTRFPLEGAHARVACSGCHEAEPGSAGSVVVRYRPLGTACRDCHGGDP